MEGWQRAFVLHARPYSETSLLLDFFTEHRGRVRILAKGARSRRSALKGVLQPFTPILARWSGRGDVKTLKNAEPVSLGLPLSGLMLYSGLYINELLSRVLAHETDYSTLFFDYLQCLQWLAGTTGSPEPALRRFELALLEHLGYGVDFLHCAGSGDPVADTMTYRYREEKGFLASILLDHYSFTGRELRALASREFPDVDTLRAAKRFTRIALKPYLGGKPLKSRELFRQFMDRRASSFSPVTGRGAAVGDSGTVDIPAAATSHYPASNGTLPAPLPSATDNDRAGPMPSAGDNDRAGPMPSAGGNRRAESGVPFGSGDDNKQ